MTPEQEHFWDVLRADPVRLCHTYGKELQLIKSKKQFDQRADECLDFVMSNFDSENVLRTVKTWLSLYKLPLDPGELESFDKFHTTYGHMVIARSYKNPINSYEQTH